MIFVIFVGLMLEYILFIFYLYIFVSVVPLHALFFPKLKTRKVKTTESIRHLRAFSTVLICQLPDFALNLKCLTLTRPLFLHTHICTDIIWVVAQFP